MSEIENSFLALLYQKKAAVLRSQAKSGVNCDAALKEVNRQISQCSKGGDLIKGKGVTKSGKED